MTRRVFVIGGGGMVGATAAYAVAIKRLADEVVLIDVATDAVRAQANDIDHATAFAPGVRVRTGDYSDMQDDDIVVVTCGAAQKPGQSRLELLQINARIIRHVTGHIRETGKNVFIVMVANPVDVLTHIAHRESGLPAGRVLGTGTTLDSARLRVLLARQLGVNQDQVEGYILGEHGDSSFAALSQIRVGGVPLRQFPGFRPEMLDGIEDDVRQAAYEIISAGKASHYGIGNIVAAVVGALQSDTATVLPVCTYVDGAYGLHGVTLGLPSLVSSRGAKLISSYPLEDSESVKLAASARVLQEAVAAVTESAESNNSHINAR